MTLPELTELRATDSDTLAPGISQPPDRTKAENR